MLSENKKVGQIGTELLQLSDTIKKVFTAQGHDEYLGKLLGDKICHMGSDLCELYDEHKKRHSQPEVPH